MAIEAKVKVFEGPVRWNMLLGSLWEGKSVRFRLCGKTRISIAGYTPSEWLDVRIMSMGRPEEFGLQPRPTDEWVIKGEVLSFPDGIPLGLILQGTYNSYKRNGKFVITERSYKGGDYWFGWDDEKKSVKPVSEYVAIS